MLIFLSVFYEFMTITKKQKQPHNMLANFWQQDEKSHQICISMTHPYAYWSY